MGRKRNLALRAFFNYCSDTNASVCKLCDSSFIGSYSANLTRHLKSKHYDVYEKEFQQSFSNKKPKKAKFSVQFSPSEVKDACVELIITEKLPSSFFDCNSFTLLTEQIFSGLGMCPINARNIMELVTEKYNLIKYDIKKLIKNRILSLKFDVATELGRGILSINVQFVKNNKVCIKTLEFIELHITHTVDNLKEEIEKVLKNFDINKNQIYTITTDYGKNILKINESDNAIAEDNDDYYENLTANLNFENIKSIKCAARTLQLIVKDFISSNHKSLINKSRQAAKTLRTPSYRITLTDLGINQPEIDTSTEWISTLKMLQQLLKIHRHGNGDFKNILEELSIEEWTEVKNIVNVLEPIHEVMVQLQEKTLLLGDYYKLWMGLKLRLQSLSTTTAKEILQVFERQEIILIENNALISAIYLDPRLRPFLNSTKKESAKIHLKKLAAQMISATKNFDSEENIQETSGQISSVSQNGVIIIDDSDQSTSSLLRRSLQNIDSSDEEGDQQNKELQAACYEIETFSPKRLDVNAQIMEYWDANKFFYPTLYKLAKIVHGVPSTQMSLGRCFSALEFVLNDTKYNLSVENLRKLLFVKCNASDS